MQFFGLHKISRPSLPPSPVHSKQTEGFHIDLDDFLMGLLLMANELVSAGYDTTHLPSILVSENAVAFSI